jgi:hypothetical protein
MEQVCKVARNGVWAGTQPANQRETELRPLRGTGNTRTFGAAALTVLLWVLEGLSSSQVAGDSRFGDIRPKMVAAKRLDGRQVRGRGQSTVAHEI